MGFVSRRVLPVCGSFCVCCPSLRSRSRQPVKRYKKLMADVFPKGQEELPNDRKISKLCDYALKNPLRIPKIATSLEQRGYKELRHEHFGSVRVIMAVYTKLFSVCKSQMSLFAVSAINMIKTLLDQTRQDDERILGCDTLFTFAYSQEDGTYIHHLDGLLASVCLLAKENGDEHRQSQLRSAGLRAVSALIWFMGQNSHMPSDYNHVVAVIMDNYGHHYVSAEENAGKGESYHYWVKEVVKGEGRASLPLTDSFTKLSFRKEASYLKDKSGSEMPSVWARICIEKIAYFAKEATTTRRYIEPFFHYFDLGKHWSSNQGLALDVLQQVMHFGENSGIDCFLLAVLVKHLDHKNTKLHPQMKADVANVLACLAQQSKSEATVVQISVLSDILKHLCNSLQAAVGASSHEELEWNRSLQLALQDCLIELARNVGDSSLIYEMMALTLEKLSSNASISRSTVGSLLIMARIMASLPTLTQMHQSFPEALLQQLTMAMVHHDSDTRVGAHCMLETVLNAMPCQSEEVNRSALLANDSKKSLLKSASVLNVANGLLGTLKEHSASQYLNSVLSGKFELPNGGRTSGPFLGKLQNVNTKPAGLSGDEIPKVKSRNPSAGEKELEMAGVWLGGDQAALLFSALWTEANMDNNLPSNYKAMSKTFDLVLLFSSAKNSSRTIFVRAFQLALSLRTSALGKTDFVPARLTPSQQRSLFILATAMLTSALKMYNVQGISNQVKGPLARAQVDPFLELYENGLRTTKVDVLHYGTPANNTTATESLASIKMQAIPNETLVPLILSNLSSSFEMELSSLQEELLQSFLPDDGFAFRLDLQSNATRPWNSTLFEKILSFDEVIEPKDDLISDISYTDLPLLLSKTPIYTPAVNVIGVGQLLESALETAGQVAGVSVSATPLSYSAVAMRCEAFGTNARRNMSVWMNLDGTNQTISLMSVDYNQLIHANQTPTEESYLGLDANKSLVSTKLPFVTTNESTQTFQLPPVSHYDNFLRAVGC